MPNKEPIKEQSGTQNTESQPQKKDEEPSPSAPSTTLKPNPPVPRECQSDCYQEKHYRLNKRQFVVAMMTLIVLFGYTAVAFYQAYEMRKATRAATDSAKAARDSADAAKQAMHVDQRAWMNVFVGQAALEDGSLIKIPVRIINSGKTPAYNVQGVAVINLLKEKDQPDFNYRSGHPRYSINTGTAVPNFPNDLSWPVLPKYVPPDKPLSPIVTTSAIRKGIQNGSLYIVVHARITYDDVFGTHHWINFCSYAHNAAGLPEKATADTCGPYNDVDKNN